jgi:hypothetical protein
MPHLLNRDRISHTSQAIVTAGVATSTDHPELSAAASDMCLLTAGQMRQGEGVHNAAGSLTAQSLLVVLLRVSLIASIHVVHSTYGLAR